MNEPILFATKKYDYLKNELLATNQYIKGDLVEKKFSDGESYTQIITSLSQKNIILIGGTISEEDTMELYDLASGIIQLGAHSLKIVIPYFGYSTMERATKAGEVVKAKIRATLLSSIPSGSVSNHFILMDLHAEGIPYYFEKNVHCYHLYCKNEIMKICKNLCGNDFILASTDAGRAKWVESLANEMKVNSAYVYKKRLSGEDTVITGVNADVKDKNVIIYDDMIRTGSSLIKAAEVYKQAQAKDIYAVATHGLFTNQAIENIKTCGMIQKIVCMNTHPNSITLQDSFVDVVSVAQMVQERLKTI
ncbi:MAG: ribose-phosphate pyrophosphokinase [Chitinophagaceae bacterium]|nr:MAG: ribose-phosphate pyrophosphokinase [Bacteroidetes bacterium OLB11]MCC6448816.1 ribose-phosphate pyrophosphokinase [Chitinophagaceae bacterium]HMN33134.1 ribose-phosphate diphosphokinase [Chitinophagaceae bacterium]